MNDSSTHCLIMAGGVGSRFWPLSTEDNPKQFLDILGTGKSLIQMTFDRFKQVIPEENIYVLTNSKYKSKVTDQLNINNNKVLCEPIRKNTAPCIAYATAKIYKNDPNAIILISPSDHLILNEKQFFDDLNLGINHAKTTDNLVTYGVKPNSPNTGYGYIEFNQNKHEDVICKVEQFREKPDLKMANEFIQKGNFYWNSGMFAWKAQSIKSSFKNHAPSLFDIFFEDDSHYNTESEAEFLGDCFSICEDISIDYAILEKDPDISVILSSFDWSDLGTWGSLKDVVKKDDNGNYKNNTNIHLFNSNNCLVKSMENRTLLIDGLDDYVVIDTEEGLIILKTKNEQNLKKYLKKIEKK